MNGGGERAGWAANLARRVATSQTRLEALERAVAADPDVQAAEASYRAKRTNVKARRAYRAARLAAKLRLRSRYLSERE